MRKKRNMLKRNSGFIVGCVLAAGASFFSADILITEVLPEYGTPVEILPSTEKLAALEPEKVESRVFETDPFTVTASGNVIKGVETEAPKSETEETKTDENGNLIEQGNNTDSEAQENTDISDGDSDTEPGVDSSDNTGNGSYSDDNGAGSSDGSSGDDSSNPSYSDGNSTGSSDSSSGNGSSNPLYSDSNSSGSGNYSDGSGSYGESIQIQNPGNGDYYYDNSTGSGSGSNSGSGYSDSGNGGSSSPDNSGSSGSSSSDNSGTDNAWTPDDVIISGICSRYIDVSELYSYGPATIRLIRNEIFAVNGRIFNSQDLMDYFCQKSWYVPTYNPEDFDARMFEHLNDYEEANLKLILDYEDWLATQ